MVHAVSQYAGSILVHVDHSKRRKSKKKAKENQGKPTQSRKAIAMQLYARTPLLYLPDVPRIHAIIVR